MPTKRKGSPYWWVHITPPGGGKPIRRSTGTADWKEAQALEAQWRANLYRQSMWDEQPERSFEEVATEYLLASQRKRSIKDIKLRVGRLLDHFSGADMSTLSGQDIRGYISERRSDISYKGTPVSDSTINRELSILSAMINHAIVHLEWQLPNPTKGRFLRESESRVRWISKAEAARLIQCARNRRGGGRLSDFIELALNTGCRKNELLKLEWRRVDWAHNLLTLEPDDNKTGRRRTVPLNDTALAALKSRASFVSEHCPSSPWVFCHANGERYTYPNPVFKAACTDAGINDFTIHDLRHTCASWMVQSGVPLMDVKEVLGHTTIKMTEKYAHLSPNRAREAVQSLSAQSTHSKKPVDKIKHLLGR
ncbi:Tyrosine recombinase XerC [Carnimonas sp. R-84981]|uniref:tyrosine-type recombinase/integrase n=1 Tax=Carnimonas bestiolae TaxID=3402172 RepID=UPI003EDBA7A1